MKRSNRATELALVRKWARTGTLLEEIRERELVSSAYNWQIADALLEIGARADRPETTSGLVIMQRLFTRLRSPDIE